MNRLRASIGPGYPKRVFAILELVKGSRMRYEYDSKSDTFYPGRKLMNPFPANYGWIPETLSSDGEHLDVVVISDRRHRVGDIIQVDVVGILLRKDLDHKVIGVLRGTPHQQVTKISEDVLAQVRNWYDSMFRIEGYGDADKAFELIIEAHEAYKRKFNKTTR
ncbi:inorganic diphosphatase [Fodinisporobacter ferrooxydans]|uniref:inorganic diphosphatase n=1 Tax=Fodinisporobacter ferrooxydans TaxID=2901836 RepID=A0ABY4CPH2_9BACL|nr:inorganic diphosphatase [Alicyclobacillaceae bacterium MYW30-H2]